jgi:hypothetical protein
MTSSPTFERWTASAALFVLIGSLLLPGAPARAAVASAALLQPTPLVLKDGRIANVSIHVLPFANGEGQLVGDAAAGLAELTGTFATDCFLTAQVIGHVSSREVADNDTLAAHRLARARADAVQASLIGGGLPAKAIASVWDWQFLVREPRATLWVFRLVQGEDCEGAPLDGASAPLVAQNDATQTPPAQTPPAQAAPAQRAAEVAPSATASSAEATPPAETAAPAGAEHAASGAELAGVVGSAVAAEAMPAETAAAAPPRSAATTAKPEGAAARQSTAAAQAESPQRAAATAEASPAPAEAAAVPTLTRPLPALSPAQPEGATAGDVRPAGETAVAAVEPAPAAAAGSQRAPAGKAEPQQQSAAAEDPERQGKVEWGQDNVVITFATNSSYFPPGTARRLASLLGDLAEGERYRVQLAVGVSGSDQVVGATTPEEAKRYNRWLAERRLSRVREWLDENAGERQLEIEPTFQANDSSRRVVVRVAPVS